MAASLSPPLQQQLPLTEDRAEQGFHVRCVGSSDGGSSRYEGIVGDDMYNWPRWRRFNRLYDATLCGEWGDVKAILDRLPTFVGDGEQFNVENIHGTVFSFSLAREKQTTDFIKQLVEHLPNRSLAQVHDDGNSILRYAARAGNREAVKLLVEKVPDLVYAANANGLLPIHTAALFSQREVLEYLMGITNWGVGKSPHADSRGLLLLFVNIVHAEFFDLALCLINEYPHIAITRGDSTSETALGCLATKEFVFSSLNSWERFLRTVFQIKRKCVNKREEAVELARRVCMAMEALSPEEPRDIYEGAIIEAAALGNHEIVELILKIFPLSINSVHYNLQTMFHVATKYRCEGVFNLIYQIRGCRYIVLQRIDSEWNNMLHLAAKLAPLNKLNEISGAALQMQRELQWYKEVERLVSSLCKREKNQEGKTPAEVFTEEHMILKDEGEKWMKATAASYSIVAVLMVTIMSAAAITVPGGNSSDSGGAKGDIGYPYFGRDRTFIVFAIADAVSVFTSTTSLLVFLSILTSRFPTESFLYYHPTQLIVGMGTLFLSMACMMVAFCATCFLVLGRKTMWIILGPASAAACLGVGAFAVLQLPLLVELVSSTYGPGIFNNKGPPLP